MIALATALVRKFPHLIAIGDTSICGNVEWLDLVIPGPRGEYSLNLSLAEGEYHLHANDNPQPLAVFWSEAAVYLFCLALVPVMHAAVTKPFLVQVNETMITITVRP